MLLIKTSEPITLITDGGLGLITLICAIGLIKLFRNSSFSSKKSSFLLLLWITGFLSLSIFAFCGAVSHFTSNFALYRYTWPPTVIFGGFALCSFQLAFMLFNTKSSKKFGYLQIIFPTGLYCIYLVILIVSGWNFSYFGYYLVLIFLHYCIVFMLNRKSVSRSSFNSVFLKFLVIILILGIIQVIGKSLSWKFYYGDANQFLFQPANEIFHIVAIYPLFLLNGAIQKEFKSINEKK